MADENAPVEQETDAERAAERAAFEDWFRLWGLYEVLASRAATASSVARDATAEALRAAREMTELHNSSLDALDRAEEARRAWSVALNKCVMPADPESHVGGNDGAR